MTQSPKQLHLEHIYSEIHAFMRANHIRNIDLARAMGVTEQAISNQFRRKLHFSRKSAERLAKGFEQLECPINSDFLLSGRGLISEDPAHNPQINVSYYSLLSGDKESIFEETESKDHPLPSGQDETTEEALLNLRKEWENLYEKYLAVLLENKRLKRQIADARSVLGED